MRPKKHFKLNALVFALSGAIPFPLLANGDFAEFDASFLRYADGIEPIDVSRFSYGNPIPAGDYLADVYLNEQLKGRTNLQFVDNTDKTEKNHTALCVNDNLLALLDLNDNALNSSAIRDKSECELFSQLVPEAKVQFNMSNLQLDVNLPQAFIRQRPQGYIAPSQWQTGIPVAFVRYDANYYRYDYAGYRSEQSYLGIDAGINLAGWAFRHRGSQTWTNQKRNPYQAIATYVQRDVAALRGQLTIGDFYTSGALMDSLSLRGVQLASDDRMLASSVRGYAPVIRGVANSNALVSVFQNGQLLREVSVPAGPFTIDDLYPISYGGDLQVEILEANGEKRRFTVPYTAAAQLIRPGYSRYQVAVGRYRDGDQLFKDYVAQGTWQHGLTNNLTLNFGATFSKNYHSELVGVAFNTPIGSFASNITFAHARFNPPGQPREKRRGYNLHLSYNTRIEPTNTNITLAAYRYLSKDYYSLSEVMRANQLQRAELFLPYERYYRPKNQYQLSISQSLKDNWGYAYFTGTLSNFWGSKEKQTSYQLGYSNNYKKLNYRISASQTKDSQGRKDHQIYLSLSYSFGGGNNAPYLSQNIGYNRRGRAYFNTSLSGTLGEERKYSYNLSLNRQGDNTTAVQFSHNYNANMAKLGATWGRDNRNNQQLSLTLGGAMVIHPKGISLSNDLGDTFAIVHAKGAAGAKINGSIGNRLDRFGNGIMPYLEPYNINYVGIDTNEIADTVELSATEQQVIPRANQAILVNFATTVGNVVFFEIDNPMHYPPIGTEVFDMNNQAMGVVSQGGRIYSRGVPQQGSLWFSWEQKRCRIDYQLPKAKDNQPLIVPVSCKFE